MLAVHWLVSRTAFGRDLRASAADPSAATTLGVDVRRVQMLTFALGAACAGVGGVLIGAAFQFQPSGGASYLLNSLAIVVLGGLGNVLGTLVGGIALGALQSLGGLTLGDGYRDARRDGALSCGSRLPARRLSRGPGVRGLCPHVRRSRGRQSFSPPSRCSGPCRPFSGDYWLQLGFRLLIYLTLAEGWNLMAGSAGLVSLGRLVLRRPRRLCGFRTPERLASVPLPLAIAVSGLAGAVLATVVSPALFRLRGLYFTVGTLALAELLRLIMVNVSAFGGASGIFLRDDPPALPILFRYALVVALLASLVMTVCTRTRASVILRALRDDEDAAAQMGVRAFRVKLAAFVVASALAAMAGSVQAVKLGAIEPYGMFGLQWSIDTLTMVIIGGVGLRLGPLVGAILGDRARRGAGRLSERPYRHRRRHPDRADPLCPPWRRRARQRVRASLAPEDRGVSVGGAPLLEARSLVKRYGGLVAIDGVDLTLQAGTITGVIGPNGAGKSTLISLVSGALAPSQGSIRLEGRDVSRMPASERARAGIGRTYQIPRPFLDMTVEENLEVAQYSIAPFVRAEAARRERKAMLELTGLADAASQKARALPLLRRKRLEVARALALKPKIVLLDEVGAGLVESEITELIALVKSLLDDRTAIVIVEHVIRVVRECCSRSLVLNFGRMLVEGPTADILANDEVAAVYLGTHGAKDRRASPLEPAPDRSAAVGRGPRRASSR